MKPSIKKIKSYLIIVVVISLSFLIGQWFSQLAFFSELKLETSAEKYLFFVGLFVLIFVVLGVHELGHLLTGLWNGFQFELFVVGPFGIKRVDDKIKFYFNKELGHYGGIAATSPTEHDASNAKKFARVLLAGPLASLLLAIIGFSLAVIVDSDLMKLLCLSMGLISAAIFFATTIPSKTGLFFTDRKRYQRLVQPGKAQEVELAMLRIMGTFSKDQSYQNISEEDIQLLVGDEEAFIQFFGLFNLICWNLEHKEEVEQTTVTAYETCATKMPKGLQIAFEKEITQYRKKFTTMA